MDHTLSITWGVGTDAKGRRLRSKILHLSARADLGEDSGFKCPNRFNVEVIDLPLDQVLHLASAPDVEVGFRDGRYAILEIHPDGRCTLERIGN